MRTLAQIEASKKNGAKSRGPNTTEGRARSSQNACKHGLSAKKIVLIEGESEEEFQTLHHDFIARFRPQDPIEARLILEMAVNQWRLERSWALQTATVNQEIPAQAKRAKALYKDCDADLVNACAFNSRREHLNALGQLETRLLRNIDRALKKLKDLRTKFPPPAPELEKRTQDTPQDMPQPWETPPQKPTLQNEPEPDPQSALRSSAKSVDHSNRRSETGPCLVMSKNQLPNPDLHLPLRDRTRMVDSHEEDNNYA